MLKRYFKSAFLYAALAMIFGVFYREFTKLSGFSGKTNLSVIHTHYFLLGMFFFIMLALLEKSFPFSHQKHVAVALTVYHIGLNIAVLGFFVRGLTQVWGAPLSKAIDASISGVAGLGHTCLGVSMLFLLSRVKKQAVVIAQVSI